MCNPEEYEVLLDTDYLDRMGIALGKAIASQFTDSPCVTSSAVQCTIEYEAEPIITATPGEYAVPVMAQPESPAYNHDDSDGLDRGINLFAALTIGLVFIGAALFLPNRESLMKRK